MAKNSNFLVKAPNLRPEATFFQNFKETKNLTKNFNTFLLFK